VSISYALSILPIGFAAELQQNAITLLAFHLGCKRLI
jgi:hypothetical protein